MMWMQFVRPFLAEAEVFGEERIPEFSRLDEIVRGNLIGILDPSAYSGLYAVLSIYLFDLVADSEIEGKSRLIEFALHSLNISRAYSEQADQQIKSEARKEKARLSAVDYVG